MNTIKLKDQDGAVEFMSQQHVDMMNTLLDRSEEVRFACTSLPRPRAVAYRLSNGPDGGLVHWHMSCSDTVRFSLSQLPTDALMVGDWTQVIRATRARGNGANVDPEVEVQGDASVLVELAPILELARAAAAVPVTFPDV